MSKRWKPANVLGMLAVLWCITSPASGAPFTCQGEEKARIAKVGQSVVSRPSRHELRVLVNGKTLKFIDKAPYGEDMDGTRYEFCDRQDGYILLQFFDDMVFTGKLIDEASGAVTPGGEDVILSPDRRAYFASEQPDGLDGNVWKIYAINGKQSWSGYSFITEPGNADMAMAYLSAPAWDDKGRFSATAQCANSRKTWKTTLTKNAGAWDWSPIVKCKK